MKHLLTILLALTCTALHAQSVIIKGTGAGNVRGTGAGSVRGYVIPAAAIPITLLLHFNGINGSTNFVDSSIYSNIITVSASDCYLTNYSKFGSAAFYNTNIGSAFLSSAIDLTTSDFTVDWWELRYTNTAGSTIRGSSDTLFGFSSGEYLYDFGAGEIYLTPSNMIYSAWVHYAVTRSGTNFYLFQNGIFQQSASSSSPLSMPLAEIGGAGGAARTMFLDELRIVSGRCDWTNDFTVPAGEYSD